MIKGSIVALVTPMAPNGLVDWQALDKLIEWHIESGTQAIVSMGTTGESATLDEDEHCAVIKHTIEQVNHRIPVIAGTGANSTSEAIKLTQCAHDLKADAALLVTPYYNKPVQEGLYQHYKAIAEAVAIPQILYNVPGRTACDLLPETVERLAKIPNIVGIKEATGDVSRLPKILASCGDDFAAYTGDDGTSAEFLLQGGHGTISVTANVAPRQIRAMVDAAKDGNENLTHEINNQLSDIHKALFIESNPIPVKYALMKMGLINSGIRLPLTPLSSKYHQQVTQALAKIQ